MTDRENDVGFIVKQIHDDLGSYLDGRLRANGLTSAQVEVIRFLSEREGERTTLRDLEEYLGVSHPTVVGLVRRLAEKGILRSDRDPKDGRARNLSLTPMAREERIGIPTFEKVKEAEELLTRGFTGEERLELVRLLRRVQENLKGR